MGRAELSPSTEQHGACFWVVPALELRDDTPSSVSVQNCQDGGGDRTEPGTDLQIRDKRSIKSSNLNLFCCGSGRYDAPRDTLEPIGWCTKKQRQKRKKKPTKQNSRLRINLINGDDLFLHVQLDCFCTNLEREQNILKDLLAISHFQNKNHRCSPSIISTKKSSFAERTFDFIVQE